MPHGRAKNVASSRSNVEAESIRGLFRPRRCSAQNYCVLLGRYFLRNTNPGYANARVTRICGPWAMVIERLRRKVAKCSFAWLQHLYLNIKYQTSQFKHPPSRCLFQRVRLGLIETIVECFDTYTQLISCFGFAATISFERVMNCFSFQFA